MLMMEERTKKVFRLCQRSMLEETEKPKPPSPTPRAQFAPLREYASLMFDSPSCLPNLPRETTKRNERKRKNSSPKIYKEVFQFPLVKDLDLDGEKHHLILLNQLVLFPPCPPPVPAAEAAASSFCKSDKTRYCAGTTLLTNVLLLLPA